MVIEKQQRIGVEMKSVSGYFNAVQAVSKGVATVFDAMTGNKWLKERGLQRDADEKNGSGPGSFVCFCYGVGMFGGLTVGGLTGSVMAGTTAVPLIFFGLLNAQAAYQASQHDRNQMQRQSSDRPSFSQL